MGIAGNYAGKSFENCFEPILIVFRMKLSSFHRNLFRMLHETDSPKVVPVVIQIGSISLEAYKGDIVDYVCNQSHKNPNWFWSFELPHTYLRHLKIEKKTRLFSLRHLVYSLS